MTSEKDDDDFLSQMTQATTDEGETPEPDAPTVETGEPETASNPEVTPTPEPAKESTTVPLASLKAEREKRQRAEAERQRLEAELAALRQQPQTPAPDFYADPEAYVSTAVTRAQQEANQRLYAVLDAEAREAFPDYDEVMEKLVPRVQQNTALKEQIFSSPNPAKAAYKLAKQLEAMEQIQDPIAYQQQLRAQVRAELEAELKAKADAAAAAARAIPPDLANTRSASIKTADVGGDPFRELFPE